jgi:transposase
MSSWRAGCGGTRTSGSEERAGETATREGDDAPRLDSHAWLATKTDKTATCRLTRIDWRTIGRVIERVGEEQLIDGDRLSDLFEISVDEVAWRKGHRYLTLIGDHRRRCVVWGCEGKGQAAADRFFTELDPEILPLPQSDPQEVSEIQAQPPDPPGRDPDPAASEHTIGERAGQLRAVTMDMGDGYANSVREHAPQAVICIDNYHVYLQSRVICSRGAGIGLTARRCGPRAVRDCA